MNSPGRLLSFQVQSVWPLFFFFVSFFQQRHHFSFVYNKVPCADGSNWHITVGILMFTVIYNFFPYPEIKLCMNMCILDSLLYVLCNHLDILIFPVGMVISVITND